MSRFSLAIFDLGNVMYPVRLDRAFEILARHSGRTPSHFAERSILDETFSRYERGQISSPEFHAHFNRIMETELTYEQFVDGWNGIFPVAPFPEVAKAVRQLSGHMKVVALTNTNPLHSEVWPDLFADDLAHFQEVFASDTLGLNKPDPRVYQHVLETCRAEPGETIYFDDVREFVDAAAALGIHAVRVARPSDVTDELQRLGLLQP